MRGGLIGRAAELERIDALFAADTTASVLLLGDPGVGKSRLLAEVVARAGSSVFRVVGHEPERLVPLAAASELLRALVAIPDHGEALDELAFRAPGAIEPVRLFEAAHRALRSASPALLVVDDVQWVDELSLALVHYLVRAATSGEAPLRLLAAGRNVDPSAVLADDLRRLLGDRSALVELDPLGAPEALELVHSLDPTLTPEQADDLCSRSGGIPFWLETLARTAGAPVDAGRLLTVRLRGATQDSASLVALLAVVARPLAIADAEALLGWPERQITAAADELVSRGVVLESESRLRLSHDLVRAAAFAEIAERRRRQLHLLIADWLEEEHGDDLAPMRESLEHRIQAGERPVALAAKLVSSPQRRRLGSESLAVLLELADGTNVASPDGRALGVGVAELASELGEHRAALERWSSIAPALEGDLRFEAFLAASSAAFRLGGHLAERARALLEAAVACAASEEQLVRTRAHEARILLWLEHRTADGAEAAREAVRRSSTLEPGSRARIDALQAALQGAMQEDDGEEMLRLADEMLGLVRDDDPAARCEALFSRGNAQIRARPLAQAEASYRAAWEVAVRHVLPEESVVAASAFAWVVCQQGRLEEAELVLAEIRHLELPAGSVPGRLVRHDLAIARGTGKRVFEECADEIEQIENPHVRILPRLARAQALARIYGAGAEQEVRAELARARADAAAAACPRCSTELHVVTAEALARVGRQAEAEAELAAVAHSPMRDARSRHVRLHARAVVTVGVDGTAAETMLAELCSELESLDRRLELLWARIDLARSVVARDKARAVETLRAVAAAADESGAGAVRDVAEQELRGLGVRTWRRGRNRVAEGSLSAREQEIADLVVKGASNPEIARELFLSRKTVERHVSNVLAKAGVRNRVELAALLAAEGEGSPR